MSGGAGMFCILDVFLEYSMYLNKFILAFEKLKKIYIFDYFTGYVLSRDALGRFVNRALTDKSGVICKTTNDAGIYFSILLY